MHQLSRSNTATNQGGAPLPKAVITESAGHDTLLNQHELTNQYRRLAAEFGKPASVEQQTNAEWLAAFDAAEVT